MQSRKGKRRAKGVVDIELLTELTRPSSPERRLLMQYEAARASRAGLQAAADAQQQTANLLRQELEDAGVHLPEDVI